MTREMSVPAGSVEIGGPLGARMDRSFGLMSVGLWASAVDGPFLSVAVGSVETGGPLGARMDRSFGVVGRRC